jgi:hypothetical protein
LSCDDGEFNYERYEDDDFRYDEKEDDPEGNINGINSGCWLKDAAKIIAGLKSRKQIKQRLVNKLMREETNYAISRYFYREGVPSDYWNIVESDDCIESMVKGIFYKVTGIKHSDKLDIEVLELCVAIKKNVSLLIVYDRVGLVQKFVHSKVDEFCGQGSHGDIPKNHMRNLLAVARLHLYLSDHQSKDHSYSLYMDELSKLASDLEYYNPKATVLPTGKRFIPKWRVRHLQPLSYFYTEIVRWKIDKIKTLDERLPLDVFGDAALKIYATSST